MLYKEFYSELGKLIYAVADIDKVITQQEKIELHKIVKEELLPLDRHVDEFGMDAAYYSEIEFEFNEEQIIDSESAFESFIDFITEHHTAFDETMKKVCIHVVEEIASSYHGKNKKEKTIITKLRAKLKNLNIHKSNKPFMNTGIDPLFSAEPSPEYLNTELPEPEPTAYGNLDDIMEEYNHKFDNKVKRMSRKIAKNILGTHTLFI